VVVPEVQDGTCDYLLEFSFTTWVSDDIESQWVERSQPLTQNVSPRVVLSQLLQEKQQRINLEFFQVRIDSNEYRPRKAVLCVWCLMPK